MENKELVESLNKIAIALQELSKRFENHKSQDPKVMFNAAMESYAKNFETIMDTTQKNILAHKEMFDKLLEGNKKKFTKTIETEEKS